MKKYEPIIEILGKLFNEKQCSELCRQSQFIQRASSKLKGYEFISTMIIPSEGLFRDSLKGLCKRIKRFNPDADLSAQALCLRINQISSSRLMKAVFGELITQLRHKTKQKCPKLEKTLNGFENVYIEDSTVARLNEQLQNDYKGTNRGGCGPKAQVKINVIHDIMRGILVEASISKGSEPDQNFSERIIKHIKPDDLVIRDLGYFVLKTFKLIDDCGAYFLSRLQPGVNFYLKKEDKKALDIGEYLKSHHKNQNIIEIEGFLGADKLKVRLIIYRQSEEMTNARLRQANKQSRSTGKTMSKGKKLCLRFTMFITNAPKNKLPTEMVGTVYRIRWEIELIFKRWKSQLSIDFLKGIKKERIECLIWSRLCSIILMEMVNGYVKWIVSKRFSEELSEVKLIQYLLRNDCFINAITKNTLRKFFKEMEKDLHRSLLKDRRKRKTMRDRVASKESYYGLKEFNSQRVA